ncbi:TetR/AcrR family transcriptional regulator [Paenibacillus sp. H1-7]|nr:TetR/AcrR family transcriptional regulator [Paenibacillus sp. H1-7]
MEDMIRTRILQAAAELFQAKGYRSVTLSELATRLGMSKKTLYLYFSGKEQIAEAVMELTMKAIAAAIAEVRRQEADAVTMIGLVFAAIKQEIVKLNPLFLEDIQKFIPGLWERIEAFRVKQLSFLEELITQAQQDGLIRDLNPRLATVIMLESIRHFARPDFAAKHGVGMVDVGNTLFTMFIEGIRK